MGCTLFPLPPRKALPKLLNNLALMDILNLSQERTRDCTARDVHKVY
jgi:hypothetical protein